MAKVKNAWRDVTDHRIKLPTVDLKALNKRYQEEAKVERAEKEIVRARRTEIQAHMGNFSADLNRKQDAILAAAAERQLRLEAVGALPDPGPLNAQDRAEIEAYKKAKRDRF